MTRSIQGAPVRAISLCGVPVRVDALRLLRGKLGETELAQKLERAVANDNTIVALSTQERQDIVDALAETPSGLAELRNALVTQLKRLKDRERQLQQSRIGQGMRGTPQDR
jgi:hypothetical protein